MTICQTPDNPYNASLYNESKNLSTQVLDALSSATGCNKQYVWETDTMTGINWCQTPVTIVEIYWNKLALPPHICHHHFYPFHRIRYLLLRIFRPQRKPQRALRPLAAKLHCL